MTGSIWTPDLVARLRELWAEGFPTAEIGRRLGLTKNQALAKAHRLGLPPRTPLAAALAGAKKKREAVVAMPASISGCRWPMWSDKARPTMEFCGAAMAQPGGPYCLDHMRVAYRAGAMPQAERGAA